MISCKSCHKNNTIKNGDVRSKQRYPCQHCGSHVVLGDERHHQATALTKAFRVI